MPQYRRSAHAQPDSKGPSEPAGSLNLTSVSDVRLLLSRHCLHTKKHLGQHFLVDRNVLLHIISAAELLPDGEALEIGPGIGALTRELSGACRHVVAIERDTGLEPALNETVLPLGNVSIRWGDAVRILQRESLPALFEEPAAANAPATAQTPLRTPARSITCVSNLPYSITSPVIVALLGQKQSLRSIVLMMQAEVADRLGAAPGTSDYGALSVFAQYHARVEVLFRVSPACFFPAPQVESAVVRLTPYPIGAVRVRDETMFFAVSRALFGQRRKTCHKALESLPNRPGRATVADALQSAGVDPNVRGEVLSLRQMADIADSLCHLRDSMKEAEV